MLNFIRWLLVLPAAIGGWCVAILITILSHSGLQTLCPVDPTYPSGPRLCGDWLPPTMMTLGASLGALLVITFATLIAPANKRRVAWCCYLAGAGIATMVFLQNRNDFALPFVGALSIGLITTLVLQSLRHQSRYGELRLPR